MPDEAISDEVLMRRFQEAFDEKAFDELLSRYHRPAIFLARNLSANPALAEDAVLVTHNTREFQRVSGLRVEDRVAAA